MSSQFIYTKFSKDNLLGDKIINYFKENPENIYKLEGDSGDLNVKESIDMTIHDSSSGTISIFMSELQDVLNGYIKKYPWCNKYSAFGLVPFNIQYYPPGGGYKEWHCERGAYFSPIVERHLFFIFYCNSVNNGGETEFFHQDYKCRAEKNKFLLCPVDWTFTHRGIPSPTEDKYIVTGWYNFKI